MVLDPVMIIESKMLLICLLKALLGDVEVYCESNTHLKKEALRTATLTNTLRKIPTSSQLSEVVCLT